MLYDLSVRIQLHGVRSVLRGRAWEIRDDSLRQTGKLKGLAIPAKREIMQLTALKYFPVAFCIDDCSANQVN